MSSISHSGTPSFCHDTFLEIAMRTRLPVTINEQGIPTAQVPFPCMWDLVEFLSYRRVQVSYQYDASHFTVMFPKQDEASAQAVLDDWCKVAPAELAAV